MKQAVWIFAAFGFYSLSSWFHTLFVFLVPFLAAGIVLELVYPARKKILYSVFMAALMSVWLITAIEPFSLRDGRVSVDHPSAQIQNWPVVAGFASLGLGFLIEWLFPIVHGYFTRERVLFPLIILAMLMLPWFSFGDLQLRLIMTFVWIAQLFSRSSYRILLLSPIAFFAWAVFIFLNRSAYQHDYSRFRQTIETFPQRADIGLIVAQHGFCEFLKFHKSIDCLSWKPDRRALDELPYGKKIFRIVDGFSKQELQSVFEMDGRPVFRQEILVLGSFLFVNEDDWTRYHNLKLAERDDFSLHRIETWSNPFLNRPSFLLNKSRGNE